MPNVSEAQRRAMAAAEHGNSTLGIPKSVGKEFMNADPGGKLPEHSKDRSKDMPNDQTQPDPTTGPMSTKGPSAGKSEGLPEAATPSSHPAKDTVGSAMSVDAIKDMGKRIGRY